MSKQFLLNTALLLGVFLIPCAGNAAAEPLAPVIGNAAEPSAPIIVVNGITITQQDYDNYFKVRAKQNKTTPDEQSLLEELLQRELLRQDAIEKKLDKRPKFIEKLRHLRDSMLMSAAMQNNLEQHPLDDATLRAEYDKQLAMIEVPKEYKVRHILVTAEDEAKAIIAELGKNKTFGELAKDKSIDTGSAKNNGDLGWITKQKVVPEFGDAMGKLEKGKYTTIPIKSKFGWHIIQLDDTRNVALPSFESVKKQIINALENRQMQEYVRNLRKKAKIEILKKTD
jgi:peptidyl-prolyl cis-trans isomerase C